jgi:N-acetylneuraminic acid mutarotase
MHRSLHPSLASLLLLSLVACSSGGNGEGDTTPEALVVSPRSVSSGVVGTAYSTTLFVSGGVGGYAWSLASGALPPGVSGVPGSGPSVTLSGIPSTVGTFSFTVEVRDADGTTTTASYQLTINSSAPPPPPGGGGTSLLNAPSPRGQHTAVWTGSEMIVWGGRDNTIGPLASGAAYDPTMDRWRIISTVGAPTGRFLHSAVWTGIEMIIWGGSDILGPIGTGGAYNPTTDTWRTVTTVGAPLRRTTHSAVWSGTHMLVWGGEGVFTGPPPNSVDFVHADGRAYDPATNNWSSIDASGPAARSHTAVWTGTAMIVWGGRDAFALGISTQNIGGVFTASTDSWFPTNTSGAPGARTDHTAVWSGNEMIVWGGRSGVVGEFASGGRYRPGSDAWVPMTTTGAPSARYGHTAVWIDDEMLVWGGFAGTTALSTGAAYAPATDSWRFLPSSFAPNPRGEHSAVAAGTNMIVWGGRTGITFLNSGAVVDPN